MANEKIAVIGLGYVGLPVAVALAERFEDVVGFDISSRRVVSLQDGEDWTGEIPSARLKNCGLQITDEPQRLADRSFIIVTVPTPIDIERRPDLSPIRSSCELIAPNLTKGTLIVFESTVYPGVTEEVCGPLLEQLSGLKRGEDFHLGYSPERINPGDKHRRLETITKVVAAESDEALRRVCAVYGQIIEAGLHQAPTIKVAEAAKVIENTQRDLNIALMNEVSVIFDRMGIRTSDVLAAARTKWNFLPFTPGLVGGHCIGVDPYYLTAAAERLGYHPEVILAGRRINDQMGAHVARRTVKMLNQKGVNCIDAKVAILGITFKENVPDIRNSRVPDILLEMQEFGLHPLVHDPYADPSEVRQEYGIGICKMQDLAGLDALILAVDHQSYLEDIASIIGLVKPGGVIVDVKSALHPKKLPAGLDYWSL